MAPPSSPKLWSASFSPWSLRVKWALKSLDFDYKTVEYQLPGGEWQLRFKTRRWSNSVPLLDAGKEILTDGLDIVRYADSASNPKMLLKGFEEWMELTNAVMGMLRCAVDTLQAPVLNGRTYFSRHVHSLDIFFRKKLFFVLSSSQAADARQYWADVICGLPG